ncbi:hypothetical protein ANANG_G00121590 [Anguilla anguilla]|uniref:Uncharacterized protein n=1 Tax=Anguilla anguilla TaxID=7936 RepID=A0A9D3RX82_ANGAN|nr:hypothetical protein ANANG_G00121590 [Anguilla anguilla]
MWGLLICWEPRGIRRWRQGILWRARRYRRRWRGSLWQLHKAGKAAIATHQEGPQLWLLAMGATYPEGPRLLLLAAGAVSWRARCGSVGEPLLKGSLGKVTGQQAPAGPSSGAVASGGTSGQGGEAASDRSTVSLRKPERRTSAGDKTATKPF